MAQRLRCPGGRPVSYERVRSVAISLDTKYQLQATANANETQTNHIADSQRVQRGRVMGGLFLGQSIKG